MIRFFLIQNRQGKTRLTKWYANPPSDESERLKLESEIHRSVSIRGKGFTNFIEFQSYKIIYRKYAGLYFIYGCDVTDNELLLMETIHLVVEMLDQYFSNVCELDIVFHFNKVFTILDEYILAGEQQDTSKRVILERMKELEKLE